jgi:hypothetical protein
MTGTLLNIIWYYSVEWLRPRRLDCDDVEGQGHTHPTVQPVLGSVSPGGSQPEHDPDHHLYLNLIVRIHDASLFSSTVRHHVL